MKQFTAKKFEIPTLKGISAKTIGEHINLYLGYVKNLNLIEEKRLEYKKDREANSYVLGELRRRLSFEYNGMRNHEVYFSSLEGGPKDIDQNGELKKAIESDCGPFEEFLNGFKSVASTTRGIGWMVLWYDKKADRLLTSWIDEQHLGQLNGCEMILAIDMWEHSYVADYQPSGKKQYVEDYFANLNWSVIEENFKRAKK
ncbi:MAG TPA: Fe-Mn family superoxide dismutase [Candidatus Paceibacterota bacterium]|jgi:Fe-Mn family superoxide dismutase|nr:Fe-Mn family superoxide dismutase [Candidatus Paceibacterota bacterium]